MTDPFRSQRLLYRAIEDNDTDTTFIHTLQSDALAYANSNPTLPRPQSRAQSARYKHHLMDKTLLAVIICLVPPAPAPDSPASPPTPIGAISLTAPRPGHEHHRTSNISVDIGAEYRRRGYGSEAIRWVLGWAFGAAGLHRVGVEGYSWNEGAVRLYEGLGFRLEGTLRESVWFRGGWHDYLSFGMLEGEWEERRGEGEGVGGVGGVGG